MGEHQARTRRFVKWSAYAAMLQYCTQRDIEEADVSLTLDYEQAESGASVEHVGGR